MQTPTTSRGGQPAAGNTFDLELWLHLVFRQKWKILGGALLGLIAAGVVGYRIKPLYTSQAMLLVRYVLDAPPINPDGDSQNFRPPTQTSEQILNSESMILQSGDSMAKVVQTITARRILAGTSGNDDPAEAARHLFANLQVEIPRRSDVIKVSLSHADPGVASQGVSELVRLYLEEHVKIHGVGVPDSWINARREEAKSKLIAAETELGNEKNRLGINTETFQEHRLFIQDKLRLLESQLRDKRVELHGIQSKLAFFTPASGQATDTNSPLSEVEREQVEIYRGLLEQIAYWKQERSALKNRFTDTHPRVRAADDDIKLNEQQKKQMERDYPFLAELRLESSAQSSATPRDLTDDQAAVAQLTAALAQLQNEYTNTLVAAENLRRSESRIVGLEREVNASKNQLENFEKLQARSTLEQNLGSGFSKIEVFQNATPPVKDSKRKLIKPMAIAMAAGLALGIGLALLSELVLDQTVKRPIILENQLNVPLFATLPRSVRVLSRKKMSDGKKRRQLAYPSGASVGGETSNGSHDLTLPKEVSELQPFFNGLRDRTIMFLERMTHKPKLIAVTGCNRGAGASTVAMGLAEALSETAEGRVLVVNMNGSDRRSGNHSNGKPICGLADALTSETRQTAMIHENLYIATAMENNGNQMLMMPKRFAGIVPQLKTSDYDYVIFDMPPVSQTSITPRLAGLMDVVLLTVESEKTHVNALRRAVNILNDARANVATVLNKHRRYGPQWLDEGLS